MSSWLRFRLSINHVDKQCSSKYMQVWLLSPLSVYTFIIPAWPVDITTKECALPILFMTPSLLYAYNIPLCIEND